MSIFNSSILQARRRKIAKGHKWDLRAIYPADWVTDGFWDSFPPPLTPVLSLLRNIPINDKLRKGWPE